VDGGGFLLLGLGLLVVALLHPSGEGGKAQSKEAEGILENQLAMTFQPIPAGTFLMGSAPVESEQVVRLKLPWTPDEDIRAEGPQRLKELRQPF